MNYREIMHSVGCSNTSCCQSVKEVNLGADDASSDDQFDLCSSQPDKLYGNSYKPISCIKQESLEEPNSQIDVEINAEAQDDMKRRKNIFRAGKRGRPSGTTKAAGYRTSTGRPLGTTKAAGFKTSPGRPLGTTKAAGYRVSPGRPPGTMKTLSHISGFDFPSGSSVTFSYSMVHKKHYVDRPTSRNTELNQ
ncbi:UPF0461 protein C5orf24 homolog isoform X1 [Hemitrygon akajei]|uniref:UPF0461 protein C5orf24 homolog isoform X1 n=1 Tax=Hypanus sabinus TaxID=79690 RepID=UPI0028C41C01|nr:UPF0461 protein C5orf24 homolog isoform X1 [Hypanus sabinus]